ncbi:exosortase A [Neptunomonas antarctica]|uniref:Exosortase A n=1 Tax=Neptunomonas antarctica TaxID=619304 RepID=A0A1N7JE32_9GAMM|nr:exosortase A [Neptunomonas antarctica]SIS47623.1 exosortase A [Neptunomonas antarctica]
MTLLAKDQAISAEYNPWKYYLPLVIVYLLVFSALFYETVWSMVSIWIRSETFAHAFLILPLSIWLVWEKRAYLRYEQPEFSWLGMVALFGAGFLWLFGYLVDALVVQQFTWVAAFIAGIWAILGNRIAWLIAFPLAFLFFLVPAGEDLVPAMMEFTADFTVALVRLTGIPVYREGLFFTLPSGNWSVVEACSGIRYLIASVTLGCLYAYLTYSSMKKRLIFIVISIIVPVIANGFRAYIIVMLGHMSDMTIATGVDHLIYGWLFFGLVIFLLITIGSWFRDPEVAEKPPVKHIINIPENHHGFRQALPSTLAALALIAIWPVFAYAIQNKATLLPATQMSAITDVKNWKTVEQSHWDWQPVSPGSEELSQYFEQQNVRVGMYLQYYFTQHQGAELINSQNLIVDPTLKAWRVAGQKPVSISLGSHRVDVDQTLLKGPNSTLLIWSWYRVGDYYTSNKYIAKLMEGLARLTFDRQDAGKITVAIQLDKEGQEAERATLLQSFLTGILPEIENTVDHVAGVK